MMTALVRMALMWRMTDDGADDSDERAVDALDDDAPEAGGVGF